MEMIYRIECPIGECTSTYEGPMSPALMAFKIHLAKKHGKALYTVKGRDEH